MRMRCKFDVNLASQLCFCCNNRKRELSTTQLLQIICCEFVTSTFVSHSHSKEVWTRLKSHDPSNPREYEKQNKNWSSTEEKTFEIVDDTYIFCGQFSFTVMIDNRNMILGYVDVKLYKISTLEEKRIMTEEDEGFWWEEGLTSKSHEIAITNKFCNNNNNNNSNNNIKVFHI